MFSNAEVKDELETAKYQHLVFKFCDSSLFKFYDSDLKKGYSQILNQCKFDILANTYVEFRYGNSCTVLPVQ